MMNTQNEQIQKIMAENNRDMAKQGLFSLELLETMQRYIDEFRSEHESAQEAAAKDDTTAVAAGNR